MGAQSSIEWTDATWTPIRARNLQTGRIGWHCEHATTGCEFCYAEGINKRLGTGLPFKPGHRKDVEIFLDETMLLAPLKWKKSRKIFVCSMTDLFARFVPAAMIDKMFAVMALCPQHVFQVLTKRADRMREYMLLAERKRVIAACCMDISELMAREAGTWKARLSLDHFSACFAGSGPFRNIWLGVSAERQQEADERIPLLLETPAAVRFVSAEPLLGPMDLTILPSRFDGEDRPLMRLDALRGIHHCGPAVVDAPAKLDWVIVGGESGPRARQMQPDWARSLRDQCAAADVPFFFKQWGEHLPVGQSLPGFGKIHGATAVKPGRMKLHYGGTRQQAPKHAFAVRGVKFASTADGFLTFSVGKKAAGRLLDGVEHNGFPGGRS